MIVSIVIGLIIAFQFSVLIHVSYLSGYISSKSKKDLIGFMVTTLTDMLIGLTLAVLVLSHPEAVRALPMDLIVLLESGFFTAALLWVKIRIGIKIYRRRKNPDNYHLNFFGKKVYNAKIVTQKELAIYFLTMPFTLFIGAYFVVKLIRTF